MTNREYIERIFPKLRGTDWEIISPKNPKYNCVAWSLCETNNWWEPDPMGEYYWPPGLPRGDYSVKAYQTMFESLGYRDCKDEDFGTEYENIAIFADQGRFKHVCRQKESGVWTSKLGRDEDIDHPLEAVGGNVYGNPTTFLIK